MTYFDENDKICCFLLLGQLEINDLQEKISLLEKQLQNGVAHGTVTSAEDFAEKEAYMQRIEELEQQLVILQNQVDEHNSNNQQQHLSELEQQVIYLPSHHFRVLKCR